MPTVAFTKHPKFVKHCATQVHHLGTGTTHDLRVALTNTAPSSTNGIRSEMAELATGNGYTSGGISIGAITGDETGGVFSFAGAIDPVWTAAGGSIGPFRYAFIFNDTPTSPVDPVIGWWDYGSAVTVPDGQTFTVDLSTIGTLT